LTKRFSAKLLFQWRPERDGVSRRRRVCEERIVVVQAASERAALRKAKQIGARGEFDHPAYGRRGGHVFFEFIGVLALVKLIDEDEVWYSLMEMIEPMERRGSIIPSDDDLILNGADKPGRKLRVW
jgi:hypothetical protein